jgi:hypothetical protein
MSFMNPNVIMSISITENFDSIFTFNFLCAEIKCHKTGLLVFSVERFQPFNLINFNFPFLLQLLITFSWRCLRRSLNFMFMVLVLTLFFVFTRKFSICELQGDLPHFLVCFMFGSSGKSLHNLKMSPNGNVFYL